MMKLSRTLAKWIIAAGSLICGACAMAAPNVFDRASAQSGASAPKTVSADIVSSSLDVIPGTDFDIAVRLRHEFGWHTYWINPGTTGKPTTIKWATPQEWEIQSLGWPAPDMEQKGPIASFVYSGQILLPFKVKVPIGEKLNQSKKISAHVEWLACKDICIPGQADISFSVNIASQELPAPEASLIPQALAQIPGEVNTSGSIKAYYEADRLSFEVSSSMGSVENRLLVLPQERGLVDYDQGFVLQDAAKAKKLYLKTTEQFQKKPPESIKALIVADRPRSTGWAVQTDIELAPGKVSRLPFLALDKPAPVQSQVSLSSLSAILFAFLGGLILNLMPCVFPVLSLKILQLVDTKRTKGPLWVHGVAFTAGILLTMTALSATLMLLRGTGSMIGWGFQLQSPWVVAILALLFFSIMLNLLGLFEFTAASHLSDARTIRKLPTHGPQGSFWTGVLAVVIASPCTAPFMGAALGYALTQDTWESAAIFLALGFGMALPWLVLTVIPVWTKLLPRPGAWMVSLRRIMALPMAVAVIWLFWVLSHQVSFYGLVALLIASCSLTVMLWEIGRSQYGRGSSAILKILTGLVAAACIALIASGAFTAARHVQNKGWERWSEQAVLDALEQKTPVIVDYTAAWCVTCQFNDKVVIRTNVSDRALAELGYRKFVADWTNRDEAITRSLASFGRNGVPLYVLYNGTSGRATILPELITQPQFVEALKRNCQQ
jgi:thiol:disulfide interchange protein DsbD